MSNQRQYCNAIIEKETALELGLPLHITKKIISSQSEFVRTTMESGTFNNVRLCYLGSFVCKSKEIQMINHMRGLNEIQRKQFRKDVLTGRIKFNWWENKDKK